MNEQDILIYLYHYFDNMEISLNAAIDNKLKLVNRSKVNSDERQLEELRDLFVKKKFLKQISRSVFDILRWSSLL